MSAATMLELFGYLGSALVIVSMLMTSVRRLRTINLIGSLLFSIYAVLIHSYPTAVMNLFLAGINVWHLLRLRSTGRNYEIAEVDAADGFLAHLLKRYEADIAGFFPGFSLEGSLAGAGDGMVAMIICCGDAPAGIFLGERQRQDGSCRVILDYTTPVYRDCSVGDFLYRQLSGRGVRRLIAGRSSAPHEAYLRRMGFKETENGCFLLDLSV